ncbi:MAG: TrkA family potassium uptake protein [Acidobacteria bacterium]|nr:TrkA family potassium uptake protein [Acidobacteriota bacterium]
MRFAVIGLGKFGSHVARTLYEKGHEVVGIDAGKDKVQDLRDHTTQAIVADCTDPETLKALGIDDCDAVVVSLGERMDASILVTLYLKEMGIKKIVAKAVSEDHGKILGLIGATEVVHPERNTALRVANALGTRSILEYLPIGVGFSLVEIAAPKAFRGKTLGELDIRKRYRTLVVAVKRGGDLDLAPGASYAVADGDILVLIGNDQDLDAVTRLAE